MKILAGTAFAFAVLLSTSAFASPESDHLGRSVIERGAQTNLLTNYAVIASSSETVQKVAVATSTDPARGGYSGK